MVKKLWLIVCLLLVALNGGAATEFDANSDGVFDDTFKFKVDNLVTSNSSSATVAANVLSILKAADYSAIRTLLTLRPGTDVQAYDADLAAAASLGAEGKILRAGASALAYSTSTFADTYAAGSLLGAASANTVAAVTTLSLDDSAAQIYDATDDTKKILVEAGGLPTSTTAQMSPIEYIHVTVVKPQDLADAVRDMFVFWSNDSGKNFVIQGWKAWAGTDNTTLAIKTCTASGGSVTTVDAVEIATDGTSIYYASDTTITSATIADGNLLFLDFDDTDDPSYVKLTIYGYFAN